VAAPLRAVRRRSRSQSTTLKTAPMMRRLVREPLITTSSRRRLPARYRGCTCATEIGDAIVRIRLAQYGYDRSVQKDRTLGPDRGGLGRYPRRIAPRSADSSDVPPPPDDTDNARHFAGCRLAIRQRDARPRHGPLRMFPLFTSYLAVHKGQRPSKCYYRVGDESANSFHRRGSCYKSPS
jgi:hypothetical protein